MGELAGPRGLTEGVLFVEWQQLKVTNDTPFAAIAALPPKGAARPGSPFRGAFGERIQPPLKGEEGRA